MRGTQVAIKAVEKSQYERLSRENQISESKAMLACHKSSNVVTFIEEFHDKDYYYIVTKYSKG